MPNTEPTGARVRRLREVAGISLRELAWLAETSPGYPAHVESGFVEQIGTAIAFRLARVLGCSLEHLLTGGGDPPTDEQILAAVASAREARPRPAATGTDGAS